MKKKQWQFWIDRGGTFTDVVACSPTGAIKTKKLLSEAPQQYRDAAVAGIRYFLGLQPNQPIASEHIASVRMGTTVATNALLERKGTPMVLITSTGFADSIRIANQTRPALFNLDIQLPEMLYQQVIEAPERIDQAGNDIVPFSPNTLRPILQQTFDQGLRSIAVVLMHSYRHPQHEKIIGDIAASIGFTQISLSHQVSPLIKLIGRGDTTLVEAYLSPLLQRYLNTIKTELPGVDIKFMQSSGGLVNADFFRAKDSILSGPAGGIVGAATVAQAAGLRDIVTFDMGGTSTDVAHYAGQYERNYETTIAGVRLRVPMMDIHTIAAGGGSIISFQQHRFQVGPRSAGSNPGPACYRLGGPLTVTDCNVMLGKIQSHYFPSLFGSEHNLPLDDEGVVQQFTQYTHDINRDTGQTLTPQQVAEGFLHVAVDHMANAIKKISVRKGHDIENHALCCFGGAAGQHACAVAENLGIKTILIHPLAGVLSAYGMGLASLSTTKEQMISQLLTDALPTLEQTFTALNQTAQHHLIEQGVVSDAIETRWHMHVRYMGTDSIITIDYTADQPHSQQQFEDIHRQRYGFILPEKALEIDMISVDATAAGAASTQLPTLATSTTHAKPMDTAKVYLNGTLHTLPVFDRNSLLANQTITGPAMIIEANGTNIIEPHWAAHVQSNAAIILKKVPTAAEQQATGEHLLNVDPIRLEIFNSLFMSIAEDMGEVLCNTAYSVNIKERKDFSCALFDSKGKLVANAPPCADSFRINECQCRSRDETLW